MPIRGLAAFATALALLTQATQVQPSSKHAPRRGDREPDTTIPVVADIQKLQNARLRVGKTEVQATISFYQKGTTVVLLPVWTAAGDVELLLGEGTKAHVHKVGSSQPLLPEGVRDRAHLRVRLRDLLSQEEGREAVYQKLTAELRKRGELTATATPQFKTPRINERRYKVTLCTSGRKDTPEVELSDPALLPPAVVEEGGVVELELLPRHFAARRAQGTQVRLQDAYLRVTGELWCRLEREEVRATVRVLGKAVTALRHQLGSSPETKDSQPTASIIQLAPGKAEMTTELSRMIAQHAEMSMMTRRGSRSRSNLVFQLAQDVLKQELKEVRPDDLADARWVTFLVGNLATLSGTVGEIKALARKDHKAREQALKVALQGRTGVRLGLTGVNRESGAVVAATSKALDEVQEFFQGKLPTLSGIHFSQKGEGDVATMAERVIREGSFQTAWVEHHWPYVRFAPQEGKPLDLSASEKPVPAKVYRMDDCVGKWKLRTDGGAVDMDLKTDGTCALTNRPDTRPDWSAGGGFVKDAKGHWSVDAKGRLTVKMTHVWVGIFWKEYEGTFVDDDKIVKVSTSEITLKSGNRLRKR
jgi:hypothetical protein